MSQRLNDFFISLLLTKLLTLFLESKAMSIPETIFFQLS